MLQGLKTVTKRAIARRLLEANHARLRADGLLRHGRLSEALWGCDVSPDGKLLVGGVEVENLVRTYGSPLHVVDVERLHGTYSNFLAAFATPHADVLLGTSYKSNPVPFVLGKLHEWGSRAEVISHFELWLALELGMPGERIIFNGPGKSRESLELAVERGVGIINLDSIEEFEELEQVCASLGRRQRIGFRVTTSVGWQSQFGLPIANGAAFRAFERAAASDFLDPIGIHLHLGTGLSSVDTYVHGISDVIALAKRVRDELRVIVSVLDLGGGFGVPTTRGMDEWDGRLQHLGFPIRTAEPATTPTPADYAERIMPMIEAYLESVECDVRELVFEPGRAITASAQMLLLSVLRTKSRDRATKDVILDGGRNLCAPLSWEFHEILPASRMNEDPREPHNLYGPLCHPHDIVALHKPMPLLRQGDVVAVMDAGAYFVPNQTVFSNPRPGVVAVEGGSARIVRSPEAFADIVARDFEVARDDWAPRARAASRV